MCVCVWCCMCVCGVVCVCVCVCVFESMQLKYVITCVSVYTNINCVTVSQWCLERENGLCMSTTASTVPSSHSDIRMLL